MVNKRQYLNFLDAGSRSTKVSTWTFSTQAKLETPSTHRRDMMSLEFLRRPAVRTQDSKEAHQIQGTGGTWIYQEILLRPVPPTKRIHNSALHIWRLPRISGSQENEAYNRDPSYFRYSIPGRRVRSRRTRRYEISVIRTQESQGDKVQVSWYCSTPKARGSRSRSISDLQETQATKMIAYLPTWKEIRPTIRNSAPQVFPFHHSFFA